MSDTVLSVFLGGGPGARAAEKALSDLGPTPHIRVLEQCDSAAALAPNLVVCAVASQLDKVVDCVSTANKSHRLAALLIHNDVADNWLPYVLYQSGIRALRNMIVHSDPDLPSRVLSAWAIGAQDDFIADAAVISGRLVVKNCAFDEYSLSFDAFPALKQIPESQRSEFELQEDGLLLFWPDDNVHLDLDDIRFANDPQRQRVVRAKQLGDERTTGLAIRRIREDAGIRQADIDGISERHIRRIENGGLLTSETLDAIANAVGMNSDDFLERLGEVIVEIESEIESEKRAVSVREPDGSLDTFAGHRKASAFKPVSPSASRVREPLRLAASSTRQQTKRQWTVEVLECGSITGHFDYDISNDVLSFYVEERHGSPNQWPKGRLVATISQDRVPLESEVFVAEPMRRVQIVANRGILGSDVIDLKWSRASE